MARKCELTGKQTRAGKRRRHRRGSAGGATGGAWSRKAQATNRQFKPNIVRGVKLMIDGKVVRKNISAKILKRIKKFGHYKGATLAVGK